MLQGVGRGAEGGVGVGGVDGSVSALNLVDVLGSDTLLGHTDAALPLICGRSAAHGTCPHRPAPPLKRLDSEHRGMLFLDIRLCLLTKILGCSLLTCPFPRPL